MAHILLWTTLWPLFGGLPSGCLSQQVSNPAEEAPTEVPRLSLFVHKTPIIAHHNITNGSNFQIFSNELSNNTNNSSNIQRRSKLDLRTRSREGRRDSDVLENQVSNRNDNLENKVDSILNSYSNAQDAKGNEAIAQLQGANYVYNSFYENHPLIQKLIDPKPQKFISGDSHNVEEEISSMFGMDSGKNQISSQTSEAPKSNEAGNGWSPTWYTTLYEAGKNFNEEQNKLRQKNRIDLDNGSSARHEVNEAQQESHPFLDVHSNNEKRDRNFHGSVSNANEPISSLPNRGSSFNVGYSIGVSNAQESRGSRTLYRPFSNSDKPNHQQFSLESQSTPSYLTNSVHQTTSQNSFEWPKPTENIASFHGHPEFTAEIITPKPDSAKSGFKEPYRYEVAGQDSVWSHLTPNVEVSLTTTAKPITPNAQYYVQLEHLPQPQHLRHGWTVADLTSTVSPAYNFQQTSPAYNFQQTSPGYNFQQTSPAYNLHHTSPSSATRGQAIYFYSGRGSETSDGKRGANPPNFDHSHALGQSNTFDFSNAMVTLPSNFVTVAPAPHVANMGYVSIAKQIQKENVQFEQQIRNMLEGKGKRIQSKPIAIDSSSAAQTFKPRNVSQITYIKPIVGKNPQKPKPEPYYSILKNSIQSVIIPLPNGKNVHMPAIIIPLGTLPNMQGSPIPTSMDPNPSTLMHLFDDSKNDDPITTTTKHIVRGVALGNKNQAYQQRPQYFSNSPNFGPKTVNKLQQPKQKRPKPSFNKPFYPERDDTQPPYVIPKYNQISASSQHTPSVAPPSSYLYYNFNNDQSNKAPSYYSTPTEKDGPLIASGTSISSSSIRPPRKDSSDLIDLSTEASEVNPARYVDLNILEKLKYEPNSSLKSAHFSKSVKYDPDTSHSIQTLGVSNDSREMGGYSNGNASGQSPIASGSSSHSSRKRKSKSKKRKKPSPSSSGERPSVTTSVPSLTSAQIQAYDAGVAATVLDPEYSYGGGYGLVALDESHEHLFHAASHQSALPSKDRKKPHHPHDKHGNYVYHERGQFSSDGGSTRGHLKHSHQDHSKHDASRHHQHNDHHEPSHHRNNYRDPSRNHHDHLESSSHHRDNYHEPSHYHHDHRESSSYHRNNYHRPSHYHHDHIESSQSQERLSNMFENSGDPTLVNDDYYSNYFDPQRLASKRAIMVRSPHSLPIPPFHGKPIMRRRLVY